MRRMDQFDFFNPRSHFAFDVPCRARSNSILANAVLAVSARHMNRTLPKAGIDPYLADHYHQACLQALIPALDQETARSDGELLATLCLLRFMEELDGNLFVKRRHLGN